MKNRGKKAPKVSPPSRKNPNYMKENLKAETRTSPQSPMKKKSLSK